MDPQLKDKKQIRILEIRCGSGANLKYFPSGSRLILVDINPSFEGALRENLLKYPELQLEKLIHCSAESMSDIPDESVDVLVSTTVLCSVPDVHETLDEALRVLVPGGKFYFLEHVLDKKGTWRPLLQKFLTYFSDDGSRSGRLSLVPQCGHVTSHARVTASFHESSQHVSQDETLSNALERRL
ncbi:hypothetical protein B566_EDAN018320 [Ephemera danica]|nr:hypothetical protein B566_EDAN018320 [Ephemera danica]